MRKIPIFDGHNDTLPLPFRKERVAEHHFLQRNEMGHVDLPRALEAGYGAGSLPYLHQQHRIRRNAILIMA